MVRHVARHTGIPVARLQDWRGIGLAGLFAAAASGLAWAVDAWAGLDGSLPRLALGAAVTAAAYAPWLLLGVRGRR